jgi:hypothetical protein
MMGLSLGFLPDTLLGLSGKEKGEDSRLPLSSG